MTGKERQSRERWLRMYRLAEEYYRQNGHIRIPQSYVTQDGIKLGIWLNQQRQFWKSGRLIQEKVQRLEELGVIWEPEKQRRSQWEINFSLLKEYKEKYGTLLVPVSYVDPSGVKLGRWLSNQRRLHLSGRILPTREKRLEELGIAWSAKECQWEQMYAQARRYFEANGHLNPYSDRQQKMEPALGDWLSRQRQQYRDGRLSVERIQALEDIGMCWRVAEEQWQAMYEAAEAYFKRCGHLHVPKDTGPAEERKLGRWISTQRKEYWKNGGQLKEGRVQRLEAIGMVWDASVDSEACWEGWFCQAEKFYRENGHLEPPDGPLRTWVLAQKYKKKGRRGGLTDGRIRRLEGIGIIWNVLETRWMHMYELAKEYYHIHEKLNIPASYVTSEGEKLGGWICHQRSAYKNMQTGVRGGRRDRISLEQIQLLNEIEMIWDASMLSTKTSFQERAVCYYLKGCCPDVCKLNHWEAFGFELDVYLPEMKTGIEYDGYMHADKREADEKKNLACQEQGIRLIRIREPGLPALEGCGAVILLEDLSEGAFEKGIRELFRLLGLPEPQIDLARDRAVIYSQYRDYVTYRWDAVYAQLWSYYQKHGELPRDERLKSKEGTSFVSWMNVQRKCYLANELTKKQIHKLERLGFVWTSMEDHWNFMYGLAQAYYQEHGDLKIPVSYTAPSGERLGKWLSVQRGRYRAKKLDNRHIYLLERLGILWEPRRKKGP